MNLKNVHIQARADLVIKVVGAVQVLPGTISDLARTRNGLEATTSGPESPVFIYPSGGKEGFIKINVPRTAQECVREERGIRFRYKGFDYFCLYQHMTTPKNL